MKSNTSGRVLILPSVKQVQKSFVTNLSRRNVKLVIYSSLITTEKTAIEKRADLFIARKKWRNAG